jgi:hypothetical protein
VESKRGRCSVVPCPDSRQARPDHRPQGPVHIAHIPLHKVRCRVGRQSRVKTCRGDGVFARQENLAFAEGPETPSAIHWLRKYRFPSWLMLTLFVCASSWLRSPPPFRSLNPLCATTVRGTTPSPSLTAASTPFFTPRSTVNPLDINKNGTSWEELASLTLTAFFWMDRTSLTVTHNWALENPTSANVSYDRFIPCAHFSNGPSTAGSCITPSSIRSTQKRKTIPPGSCTWAGRNTIPSLPLSPPLLRLDYILLPRLL